MTNTLDALATVDAITDDDALWSAILGGGWEHMYDEWADGHRWMSGGWDVPGVLRIAADGTRRDIDIHALRTGCARFIADGNTDPCTGRQVDWDLDALDFDACTSSMILECAFRAVDA